MEENTFKLVVFAIVALVLLFIFLAYFGPMYLWPEHPETVIKKQLKKAETDLGHYQAQESVFPSEFVVHAVGYETSHRNIAFQCNHPGLCCEQGKKCNKPIEWNNSGEKRYFSFKQQKPLEVSARCRYEDLYICKVYLGKEPAQVKINQAGLNSENNEIDLAKTQSTKIKYKIKNTGKKNMIAVQPSAKLYKIKKMPYGREPEKEFVKEIKGEEFSLGIGEEKTGELSIPIGENGDYQIEFTAVETIDETNYETRTLELKARGLAEIGPCIPGPVERGWLDEEKCTYYFPCEDCKSILECERKWREKYGLPDSFKFKLKEMDQVEGMIWLEVPGEYKKECRRECYPEYEVTEELQKSRKPLDLVFVIDASGSMSDDIDEVKGLIKNIYEKVGEECKIGEGENVEKEPCLQIGMYLFEGGFRECFETPSNPFFSECLREERQKDLFEYDSFYYVLCDYIESGLIVDYFTNCFKGTESWLTPSNCRKIENKLRGAEKNFSYNFTPPYCRAKDSGFHNPNSSNYALQGQGSDIGYIPITTNLEKITSALDKIMSTQGTEAWSDALYFTLTVPEMNWRPNSEKAIILITDAFNNHRTHFGGGAEKTLQQVALKAQEKKTRIFSLAGAGGRGSDLMDPKLEEEQQNWFEEFYGFELSAQGQEEPHPPDSDLSYISSQTGGYFIKYSNVTELPQKILEVIKEEVQRASEKHGLKICEEGETPEVCQEYCVLPWEEKCEECTCFKYYDEHLEEYSLLDIGLVIDASGSMQKELDLMKQRIEEIISKVKEECERIGVKNCMRISLRFVFGRVETKNLPLTSDLGEVKKHLGKAFAAGGGDEKDPWAGEALISLKSDDWFAQSKKIMLIITDAKNNPEEVVFEDYRQGISATALSEEKDRAIVELRNFAQNNGFKVFGLYSEGSTESPKDQLEWLAKQTKGNAVEYTKGEDFSQKITNILKGEITKESQKPWCTDDQCEKCSERAKDTVHVPIEWDYKLMCSDNTEECRVQMSCYPPEISLTECKKKWTETINDSTIEIKEDPDQGWLYVKGTKKKDGAPIEQGEEWTECTLAKILNCGGHTLEKGEGMPQGVDEYNWQKVNIPGEEGDGTGSEDSDGDGLVNEEDECDEEKGPEINNGCPAEEGSKCEEDSDCETMDCSALNCPNPEPKCKTDGCACECQSQETDKEELECLKELDCYCETSSDNWEYLERVKEAGKPIDFLVVLDGTRSMYKEAPDIRYAFDEMMEAMKKECKLENGEPCVRIGFLVFGGTSSGLSGSHFNQAEYETLKDSLGWLYLASEKNQLGLWQSAIKAIAQKLEEEPWADAIVYSMDSANDSKIGWRNNSEKAVLLITSEQNNNSNQGLMDVRSALKNKNAFFYGLVRNISVGGESAEADAKQIIEREVRGKVYSYNVPLGDKKIDSYLKEIFKDLVERLIEKNICAQKKCNECRE